MIDNFYVVIDLIDNQQPLTVLYDEDNYLTTFILKQKT